MEKKTFLLALALFFILVIFIMSKKNTTKKNTKKKRTKKTSKSVKQKNIKNKPLTQCSIDPLTGFHRNGYCTTDDNDSGTHTVCAQVTDEFLNYSKSKGNDLIKKRGSFPGLSDGNFWCLCAMRWKEAYEHDPKIAPLIDLDATNKKTLEYIDNDILEKYKY